VADPDGGTHAVEELGGVRAGGVVCCCAHGVNGV
jgi:hypothetical protein